MELTERKEKQTEGILPQPQSGSVSHTAVITDPDPDIAAVTGKGEQHRGASAGDLFSLK